MIENGGRNVISETTASSTSSSLLDRKMTTQKYSYGVLLYTGSSKKDRKYLLIQNRDTEAFIYFFLAWNMEKWNDNYFQRVIRGFSRDELNRLLYYPFDILYTDLYVNHKKGTYQKQYDRALYNYEYFHSRGDWKKICQTIPTQEIRWGFSKGRIEVNEDPHHCAMRELEEETGIAPSDIHLEKNMSSIHYINEKNFFKTAVHVTLFPARTRSDEEIPIQYNIFPNTIRCVSVSNEILHARWTTMEEAFFLLSTPLYRILYEFHQGWK